MHRVQKTFYTRKGQFEPDKTTEAIGIKADLLNGEGDYEFELMTNRNIYSKPKSELREFVKLNNSLWTNTRGVLTAIIPLQFFDLKSLKSYPQPSPCNISQEPLKLF